MTGARIGANWKGSWQDVRWYASPLPDAATQVLPPAAADVPTGVFLQFRNFAREQSPEGRTTAHMRTAALAANKTALHPKAYAQKGAATRLCTEVFPVQQHFMRTRHTIMPALRQ